MKCPKCGGEASLVGLPAGIYTHVSYRCYAHGEYNFSVDPAKDPKAAEEAGASRSASRANAEAYRERYHK